MADMDDFARLCQGSDMIGRDQACETVRAAVKSAFPQARVVVNKGMNLATHIAVTVHWGGGLHRTERAKKILSEAKDIETFASAAVSALRKWHDDRMRGS